MKRTDTILYINKTACISPQPTFEADAFFSAWCPVGKGDQLKANDPDYKVLITDAGKRRRMGHLIKMGVSTSLQCLKQADGMTVMPDAMMSATGMGGLEDTEKFLRCIIDNDEQLLNPSNFIQSTGNTFGGQTGLLLGHHGYNVTYAHGGFSMESALIDAMLQLKDGSINTALVTGADEITATEYEVMRKMGFWRNGRQMGEGSHSFFISKEKTDNSCQLAAVVTQRGIGENEAASELEKFVTGNGLNMGDIDLVLTGCDCDYPNMESIKATQRPLLDYKQWCGQYATAAGFGLWLGSELLSRQIVPNNSNWKQKALKNVVIYSEYRQNDYSFILLRKAD